MPQMGVNAGTTFTDIYNTFRPTGGGSDLQRVRFDNVKGLYTSQKGSTAKIEDMFGGHRLQQRAQKRQDGADAIQRAIGREYPQHAQAILTKLGQDHPGIDLGQDVRRRDLDCHPEHDQRRGLRAADEGDGAAVGAARRRGLRSRPAERRGPGGPSARPRSRRPSSTWTIIWAIWPTPTNTRRSMPTACRR